ncbi:MAG: hypothetical protein AB1426_07540 [Bacillota bacterium]
MLVGDKEQLVSTTKEFTHLRGKNAKKFTHPPTKKFTHPSAK